MSRSGKVFSARTGPWSSVVADRLEPSAVVTVLPGESIQQALDSLANVGAGAVMIAPGTYDGFLMQSQHSGITVAALYPGTVTVNGVVQSIAGGAEATVPVSVMLYGAVNDTALIGLNCRNCKTGVHALHDGVDSYQRLLIDGVDVRSTIVGGGSPVFVRGIRLHAGSFDTGYKSEAFIRRPRIRSDRTALTTEGNNDHVEVYDAFIEFFSSTQANVGIQQTHSSVGALPRDGKTLIVNGATILGVAGTINGRGIYCDSDGAPSIAIVRNLYLNVTGGNNFQAVYSEDQSVVHVTDFDIVAASVAGDCTGFRTLTSTGAPVIRARNGRVRVSGGVNNYDADEDAGSTVELFNVDSNAVFNGTPGNTQGATIP